jgi:predicted DNA-binding protein
MKKGQYTQISVYLTDQQDKDLRKLKARTRIPIAIMIREAIDAIIKKYMRRK